MKKKGVRKGQQSKRKTSCPYHRRDSLQSKTVGYKRVKMADAVSRRKCHCGLFMSPKTKANFCIVCKKDMIVINKYPEMQLIGLRVRLGKLADSCSSSYGTYQTRINLNLRGKQLSEMYKCVESPIYTKPEKASKSPRVRKSIITKKPPVKEKIEKTSPRAGGVRLRKRGQSAVGRDVTKGVTKKKLNTKSATRNITLTPKRKMVQRSRQPNCTKNTKSATRKITPKRKMVQRSRQPNSSRESSHTCRVCGMMCESNVAKLAHEINHENKILFVRLDQCDKSQFLQFASHNGETSEGDRRIDSSGMREGSDTSAHYVTTELVSSSSPIRQCSEEAMLETFYTGLVIQSDNVSATNDFIVPSDAHVTVEDSNQTEPTRSHVNSSLVETVDEHVVNATQEFVHHVDVSSQPTVHVSSDTWDRRSDESALEGDEFSASGNGISSSVSASRPDHSDCELLIDEEDKEDSLDVLSDSSNLESQNLSYGAPMKDSECTENAISEEEEVGDEGEEPLLEADRNETDESSPLLNVKDVEAAPSGGMQEENGTEQHVQEEMYESESGSGSPTYGNEERNHSPALDHPDVPGCESEPNSNMPEGRVHNQVDSVMEMQLNDVYSANQVHASADGNLYEGGVKTCVSWSATSCSLGVVHADVSCHITSQCPSTSTSGEPPVGLSEITSSVPEDEEGSDIEEVVGERGMPL